MRIKIVGLCVVLMILLSLVFNSYVAVQYDYWFQSYQSEPLAYIPAIVAIFLPLYFSRRLNKPSDFLCWLYYLLVTVSTTLITPQMGLPLDVVFKAGLIVISANILLIVAGRVDVVYIRTENRMIGWKLFVGIFLFLGLASIVLIFGSYKFNLDELLSLAIFVDTYDIRENFRDAGAEGLATYAIFWSAKVLFPGLIAFGLCYKNKTYVIVGIFFQLLLFSVSAHKSFFFSVFLVLGVYFFVKKNITLKRFLACAVLFVGFSLALFYFLSVTIFLDIIVRRVFIVPGVLSGWWVQFFSENQYAFFAGGSLGAFFANANTIPAAFRIGDFYFNNFWTSANVNFAIDAFGNGGFWAVSAAYLIVFFALTIINGAARLGENERVFFTCISVPLFWTLIETSLVAAMITHGLFILLAVAFFWKPPGLTIKKVGR